MVLIGLGAWCCAPCLFGRTNARRERPGEEAGCGIGGSVCILVLCHCWKTSIASPPKCPIHLRAKLITVLPIPSPRIQSSVTQSSSLVSLSLSFHRDPLPHPSIQATILTPLLPSALSSSPSNASAISPGSPTASNAVRRGLNTR